LYQPHRHIFHKYAIEAKTKQHFLFQVYFKMCDGLQLSYRFLDCFYRAMHFSAKRGIAIACRLSVRLSVCL